MSDYRCNNISTNTIPVLITSRLRRLPVVQMDLPPLFASSVLLAATDLLRIRILDSASDARRFGGIALTYVWFEFAFSLRSR